MHWPQLTYLALVFTGLGLSWAKHGEPRSPENGFTTAIASVIALSLLYFGGFFSQP